MYFCNANPEEVITQWDRRENGETRYRLPRVLRKNLVLFNWHPVKNVTHLVIVEGCWSLFRLDVLGIAAMELMGPTLCWGREKIIQIFLVSYVTLLIDGDEPDRTVSAEHLARLAQRMFSHVPDRPEAATGHNGRNGADIALKQKARFAELSNRSL